MPTALPSKCDSSSMGSGTKRRIQSKRLPIPGVEPENSSTAPAPNTAMALACGVTAESQVRPNRARRTIGPRCTQTSCPPSNASATAKGAK